jgi:hypothetical protein
MCIIGRFCQYDVQDVWWLCVHVSVLWMWMHMCLKLLLSIMRGMTHVHKWLCEYVSVWLTWMHMCPKLLLSIKLLIKSINLLQKLKKLTDKNINRLKIFNITALKFLVQGKLYSILCSVCIICWDGHLEIVLRAGVPLVYYHHARANCSVENPSPRSTVKAHTNRHKLKLVFYVIRNFK